MTKPARMEVPPTPEIMNQDGVVIEEADAKNRGVMRARRRHPLESLRGRGSITAQQYDAGMEFWMDFAMSEAGGSSSHYDGVPPPDTYQSRTPSLTAMQAGVKVQAAKKALGTRLSAVAVVICGQGHSVAEFAKRKGLSPHQGMGYLIAALDRLTDYYGG